jgi:hypothetical protein
MHCRMFAGNPDKRLRRGQEVKMRFLSKRPVLFALATTVATFLAHVSHSGITRGFHEW